MRGRAESGAVYLRPPIRPDYSKRCMVAQMDSEIRELVESLHSTEGMTSLVIAGAGAPAMGWILGVAGASRTVLDIQVPYASSAMIDYLGSEPGQYVSEQVALELARAAYRRAVGLREGSVPVVGLSCSATIATDRPKRGDHRCHVSTYDGTGWTTWTLTLTKGLRDRDGEDDVVSKMILNALAESLGVEGRLDPGLSDDEKIVRTGHRYGDALEALAARHVGHVHHRRGRKAVGGRGSFGAASCPARSILCTRGIPDWRKCRRVSLTRPLSTKSRYPTWTKPDLELSEVRRRLSQFEGKADAAVTRVPVFYEKARHFPGSTFIIGFDTMIRLVEPRYYGDSVEQMRAALSELRGLGCGFLIAGRVEDGAFRTLDSLPVPPEYADMFTQIPESAFREDISSTELRRGQDSQDRRVT